MVTGIERNREHFAAVDEDILSLSAILLDEGYYEALQEAKRQIDGITIIDETLLIPFKARAVLDLTNRLDADGNVDRRSVGKHRNDIFRLTQPLRQDSTVELPETVRQDLQAFVDLARADETLEPSTFNFPLTRDEASRIMRAVYGLT